MRGLVVGLFILVAIVLTSLTILAQESVANSPVGPTMIVNCTGYPHSLTCTVQVNIIDERPLAVEVYTSLELYARNHWHDTRSGNWGFTINFSSIPCFLGRPYVNLYLKDLIEGGCEWVYPGEWLCPPQNVYGVKSFTANCIALPVMPRGEE